MAKFTKVPTCLIYCLDRNCLQLFTLLVNRWYYWESKDKLIDNKFFAITNEDIHQITHLSNRTIIEVISTLYNNNIIEVKSEGQQGKRVPNYYAINWNQIEELDKLELSDLKNKQIKKIARGMSCSYRNDSIIISSKENTTIESNNNTEYAITEPTNNIGSTDTPNENGIKDGNTQLLHMRELNHNYDIGVKSYDNNSPYGFVNNVNERFRKNMNLKLHHETLINKYKEDPSFFPNDIIDEYYFLCRLRDGNTPTVEVSNNNSMTFSPLELASILGEDLTDEVEDEEIIDNSTENEPIEEDEDLADEVEEEIIDEESKNDNLELSTFDSVSIEKKSVEDIPTIIDGIDVSGIDVNANYDVQTPNGYVNTLLQSLVKGNINSMQFRQDIIRTNGIYPNFFTSEIKSIYNLL